MSALSIVCSGTMYTGSSTVLVMQHRCPELQPGGGAPVNRAAKDEQEEEQTAEGEAESKEVQGGEGDKECDEGEE